MHNFLKDRVNLSLFVENWAAVCGITNTEADENIHKLFNLIYEYLRAGKKVQFSGFGAFEAQHRKPRFGVNPRNPTERILIPDVVVAKFKAGEAFKSAIKIKPATKDGQ